MQAVTAFGRLFRTTAFKISLAYLIITSIGAVLVLFSVGWNVKDLIEQQIRQTVDADIVGLSEQYSEGGITRLVEIIDQRVKQPGAGLYLVTTHAGEPIVGNVSALPPGALDKTGVVETTYQVKGIEKRALARVFALSGGFRLLVGHDLTEGETLRPILWHALLTSLVWLTIVGTIGGLILARRVLRRVDSISVGARRIVEGDLSGRLPMTGSGRRTRSARRQPQRHAGADRRADGGTEGGLRQCRARSQDAADPPPHAGGADIAVGRVARRLSRGDGEGHR